MDHLIHPPEMLLLNELPLPKQDGISELARHLRTSLNAHKIYPMGHKMIVQSIGRLLTVVRRLMGDAPHFVVSLFEDDLEFNGERLKKRGEEAKYARQIAMLFKDQRLQTLTFLKHTNHRDVSALFSLLMTNDPIEDGELDFRRLATQFSSLWVNTTVIRRTVGDKVRGPEVLSSADLPDASWNDLPAHDPDAVIANLPPHVRSGKFVFDLLSTFRTEDDAWPSQNLSISQLSSTEHGLTPLGASGEFASFSMPGLTDSAEHATGSKESISGLSTDFFAKFDESEIGGELLLEMEDEPARYSSPSLSVPGLPPVGELSSLPLDLQDRVHQEMMKQLQDIVPQALNNYVQQLSTNDPKQASIRQSILKQLTPDKVEASQEELVKQMESASAREELAGAVTMFEELVDQQLEKGILVGVSRALERLEERAKDSTASKGIQAGTARVIEHLQREENLQQLLEQGVEVQQKDARQLLSQLAPGSLPHCIKALAAAETTDERKKYAELLIELSRNAAPDKREQAFAALIQQLGQLPHSSQEKEFFLELLRSYSPLQFETYIIQRLPTASESEERGLLLRQAIGHDSPKLRSLLMRLFESRAFAEQGEQEELLFLYLLEKGEGDVLKQLSSTISDTSQPAGLRHGAVWLYSALAPDQAMVRLQPILLDKQPNGEFVYPEDLRFQAVHAMGRLPRSMTEDLLSKVRDDQSVLVQAQASLLLNEPITLMDTPLPKLDESMSETLHLQPEQPSPSFPEEEPLPLIDRLMTSAFWTPPKLIAVGVFLILFLLAMGWMLGQIVAGTPRG
jgi:hypothetical protein